MFSEALRTFLAKPHIARMSTIDENGFPHTVPVWYAIDGDEFVITVPRNTKKWGHIQVNPKGNISIGGAPEDKEGWLFKGDFVIAPDETMPWLEQMTYHYEPAEQAAKDLALWATWDIGIVRMKPEKVIKTY